MSPKPLRIAVSDLDSYAYYRNPDVQMTGDEFLTRIRREEPMSEKASTGSKVHAVIESMFSSEEAPEVPLVWDCDVDLPEVAASEVRVYQDYEILGRHVVMAGRVDAIYGFTAADWKVTFRAMDAERYLDSWQWRAYLRMLGEDYKRFRYQIFRGSIRKSGNIHITDSTHYHTYRYSGMEDAVDGLVFEFVEHALWLGWDGYRAPWKSY